MITENIVINGTATTPAVNICISAIPAPSTAPIRLITMLMFVATYIARPADDRHGLTLAVGGCGRYAEAFYVGREIITVCGDIVYLVDKLGRDIEVANRKHGVSG